MRATIVLSLLFAPLVPQGPPPSPVRVDPVGLDRVQDQRPVTGELRATRRALVATREAGLVAEVLVREGGAVAAGDVLVRLDASVLEAELAINAAERAEGQALLAEREAQNVQTSDDLAALEALLERGAANPKEAADARSAAAAAAARLAQAQAALETTAARRLLLEQRLADHAPTAPFAGRVVARRVERGQWVETGGPLFELVSDEACEAWLDVPQHLYASVADSDEAFTLTLDTGGELRSIGRRAVPEVAAGARTFPLIVELAPDPRLAPGMTLTANLPNGELREVLTVHRDGVLRNEVGAYVYVAHPGADGGPHQVGFAPVEVLFLTGERAAVRSPALQPGALVVVEGNERLYPTAPVTPVLGDAPVQGEQAADQPTSEGEQAVGLPASGGEQAVGLPASGGAR